jgi:hypothetical protein
MSAIIILPKLSQTTIILGINGWLSIARIDDKSIVLLIYQVTYILLALYTITYPSPRF